MDSYLDFAVTEVTYFVSLVTMGSLGPRSELLSWWNSSLLPPPCILSLTGAVELWELDENETLIVSKFCKYEHDDIVRTVRVLRSGTQAVSGSQDFWWVLVLRTPVPGPPVGICTIRLALLCNVLDSS